jgi:hypothetical protein
MTDTATHSRRARRAIRRVEAALGSELNGETIEAAVYANRWIPFLELFLLLGAIGDVVFVAVAKPYYVAATSSRVFFLTAGRFWPTARKQVFTAPVESIRIEQTGMRGPLRRQMRLQQVGGSETRLSVHRMYWKELERLQSLVGG